eukprot:jgi/Botrbrau1/5294/Bobra.0391s0015.1
MSTSRCSLLDLRVFELMLAARGHRLCDRRLSSMSLLRSAAESLPETQLFCNKSVSVEDLDSCSANHLIHELHCNSNSSTSRKGPSGIRT